MAGDLKYPGWFDDVSTQHVSDLLAVINKIETHHNLEVPSHRAREERSPQLSLPSFRHVGRISEILDAFAILCTRKKHEAIALAVRHDARRETMSFMMASDSDVPRETERHFNDMWTMMQRLADRFKGLKESKGSHGEDISPRGPIQDAGFQQPDHEFTQMCLQFVWPRLQGLVNWKFSKFMEVVRASPDLDADHPFSKVAKSVREVSLARKDVGNGRELASQRSRRSGSGYTFA